MEIYRKDILAFLLVFSLLLGMIPYGYPIIAYAKDESTKSEPDMELYIHGEEKNSGPIFHPSGNIGNGLWYPGKTEEGIIRVYNNYSQDIKVTNLGLTLDIEKKGKEVGFSTEELKELFAKNMEITITRGRFLIFEDKIYDKNFYGMFVKEGNDESKGYDLPDSKQFVIAKGKHMDLKYQVHMSEQAGNELQGLKAAADFLINSHEISSGHNGGGGGRDDEDIKDNSKNHWAHDCIKTLLAHGIIQGYPDGTIRPENYITRAEAAVLIANALGLEEKEKFFSGYMDRIPKWARGHIIAVSQADIFKGYPGRLFKAEKNITREEMVTVLIRGFNKYMEEDIRLQFSDKEKISDWAEEYVKEGVANDIIVGYPDNTFKPQNHITRAEAFTIICKLLGYHEEHKK